MLQGVHRPACTDMLSEQWCPNRSLIVCGAHVCIAHLVENLPTVQETPVREDPLEKA